MASITFYGAAGTVTGSRFLLEYEGSRVLVDCGLFQGRKDLRERNWAPWPFDSKTVDAVVLTHAHIDHTGGLPLFVRNGYRGPIYSTGGTKDLCGILLPDSARIQEEEARYANKRGYSKHQPALPLYQEQDAFAALRLFETFGYDKTRPVAKGTSVRFTRAGHILGSAICTFELAGTHQRVVFTGDLGRYNAPILKDPEAIATATTLIAESTYGDREHGDHDPQGSLADVVNDTVKRGGMLVVPAFAVGRTQDILYHLGVLERAKRIPELPVYVDSPMACDATPLYLAHSHEHDFEMRSIIDEGHTPLRTAGTRFVTARKESQAINSFRGPGIIIALHRPLRRLPVRRHARPTAARRGAAGEAAGGAGRGEGEDHEHQRLLGPRRLARDAPVDGRFHLAPQADPAGPRGRLGPRGAAPAGRRQRVARRRPETPGDRGAREGVRAAW